MFYGMILCISFQHINLPKEYYFIISFKQYPIRTWPAPNPLLRGDSNTKIDLLISFKMLDTFWAGEFTNIYTGCIWVPVISFRECNQFPGFQYLRLGAVFSRFESDIATSWQYQRVARGMSGFQGFLSGVHLIPQLIVPLTACGFRRFEFDILREVVSEGAQKKIMGVPTPIHIQSHTGIHY